MRPASSFSPPQNENMKHKETTRYLICLIVCFTLTACSSVPLAGEKQEDARYPLEKEQSIRWENIKTESFMAIPQEAAPGEPFAVVYVPVLGKVEEKTGQNTYAELYSSAGKKISTGYFWASPLDEDGHGAWIALLTPPSTALSGKTRVRIKEGSSVLAEIPFTIREREFISEIIPLNQQNTTLRVSPDPKKTAEAKRLWAILSTTGSEIYSTAPFITPVPAETRRSSFFGDRRVYRYADGTSDTATHAGIDYAVPKGSAVYSAADGRVMLASPRIVTGNSVIIEHLPGVYSIYYHLENIKVKEGDQVLCGELIGFSGATGLATGPHLHWEIRVSTENADPDVFVARPLPDRRAILQNLLESF